MFEWIFNPYDYPFWILILSISIIIIWFAFRSFFTYIKFIYPNAKFEAIGNPFILEKELDHLLDAKTLPAFKESLNILKDYKLEGESVYEVQQSLDDHFIQTLDMMRKDSSKKMNEFYDMYLEKLDSSLVKNELKRKMEGKEIKETKIDKSLLLNTKKILQKLMNAERESLPEVLKSCGFEKEVIDAVSDEDVDFLVIDSAMDKHLIERFRQVRVPYKCEQAKQRFVNSLIDIHNIKNVLRAKQLSYDVELCKKLFLGEGQEIPLWKFEELTEVDQVSQVIAGLEGTSYYNVLRDEIENYDKQKSVQVLENALDGLLLKLVKNISMKNYLNIGPTIRFLISKEVEIENLKIIAKSIGESLPRDAVRGFFVMEAS